MLAGENSAALPRGSFNKVDKAEELSGKESRAYNDEEKSPASHKRTLLEMEILFDFYCNSNNSFCQEGK